MNPRWVKAYFTIEVEVDLEALHPTESLAEYLIRYRRALDDAADDFERPGDWHRIDQGEHFS